MSKQTAGRRRDKLLEFVLKAGGSQTPCQHVNRHQSPRGGASDRPPMRCAVVPTAAAGGGVQPMRGADGGEGRAARRGG